MATGRGAQVTFQNNIPDLLTQLPDEVEKRLLATAILIEGEVKEILSGQRSGRTYTVPGTKKTWQASKPFEAASRAPGRAAQKISCFYDRIWHLCRRDRGKPNDLQQMARIWHK